MAEYRKDWWHDRMHLSELAQYMYEHGDASEIARMIEKPYNYDDEYKEMLLEQEEEENAS